MPPAMASAPSSSGPVEAPGENAHLKLLAAQVGIGNAAGQFHRHRLGIA